MILSIVLQNPAYVVPPELATLYRSFWNYKYMSSAVRFSTRSQLQLILNSARKYTLPERFFVIPAPALGTVNTLCWSWSLEFYFAYDAPGFKLNRTGDGVELHLCSGNLWIQSRSNYRLCVGEGCLFVCEWVSAVLFSILTGNVNGKVNNTH